MFMQSNLGAYEVRRDSQTNRVSIEPISQNEYYSRTTEQYSSGEYDEYINDFLGNLTYDINTFFSTQRVISMLSHSLIHEHSNNAKPKVSLENFERLDKSNEVTNCGICFENMEDNIKLKCEHIYCNRCIKKWLTEKSNTCPTCREEIVL